MGSITPSAEQIRYIQLRSRWLRRDGNAGIADDLDSLLTLLASLSQELEMITDQRETTKAAYDMAFARAEKAEQELERIRTEHEDLLSRSPSVGCASAAGSPRNPQPEGDQRPPCCEGKASDYRCNCHCHVVA